MLVACIAFLIYYYIRYCIYTLQDTYIYILQYYSNISINFLNLNKIANLNINQIIHVTEFVTLPCSARQVEFSFSQSV